MTFFAPGWMSQNEKRALRSVRQLKLGDYAIIKVAMEAPLASVRTAAIDRLANADDLVHYIRCTRQWKDQRYALSRLLQTEPLKSAWNTLDDMDRETVLNDKTLQYCLKCVARHGSIDVARRAVSYIGDQKYLKFIVEERLSGWHEALSCITDQNILGDLLAKSKNDENRAYIMSVMRDSAPAYALARSTENPAACAIIIRSMADKALALEIMGQTLDENVCTACAELVDICDVTDERRLAILALCGPETVRQQAGSCLVGEEAYVGIAIHEGVTRFPVYANSTYHHEQCLCGAANQRLSDDAKQRLRLATSPWQVNLWSDELRQCTDAVYLLDMIALCPSHYCTRAVCARLDAIDEGWAQKLDNRTVEAMVDIISSNRAEEKFDLTHIASALKQIYRQGRAEATIAALRGRTVAHNDASSMERRDRSCHEDQGYTYFELDESL